MPTIIWWSKTDVDLKFWKVLGEGSWRVLKGGFVIIGKWHSICFRVSYPPITNHKESIGRKKNWKNKKKMEKSNGIINNNSS